MVSSQSDLFKFDRRFLDDHAGNMVKDPQIALIELVANSSDAASRRACINWPDETGGTFEIIDDGEGMTKDDFCRIWHTFNYNRINATGSNIVTLTDFEEGRKIRRAYGRNGKGRHSMFCFSDNYTVETWKDGFYSIFNVTRATDTPFNVDLIESGERENSGTIISCNIDRNYISEETVIKVLGSKFITDPSFEIYINNKKIEMLDLEDSIQRFECEIPGEQEKVEILKFDSEKVGRTSHQHGVAWWVNNRLVIENSWEKFMDARTTAAKRFTFIILADMLEEDVNTDWTAFRETERVTNVTEKVNICIRSLIDDLLKDARHERKINVIKEHESDIGHLNNISQEDVGKFIDEVQKQCPTIKYNDLSNTTKILTNMYLSERGYTLLQQLSELSPGELDNLGEILDQWSINDARKVLNELYWRLELIESIDALVEDPNTKELQELQPLFNKGLWIFGPEFEGIENFRSNKTLATVVKDFFGEEEVANLENPSKRPDFVLLENSSIGVYSSNEHDDRGEVCGYRKILVLELKRGGSTIAFEEKTQALQYAEELSNCGKLSDKTKIVAYVLGANIDPNHEDELTSGDRIIVWPRSYNIVLQQAHARTFNLITEIEEIKGISVGDPDVKAVLNESKEASTLDSF